MKRYCVHSSNNPGNGTILPAKWKRDLLKRLQENRSTADGGQSSLRFIHIPPSWLHNGELKEESFRLLDHLTPHTERGRPISIYERVEPNSDCFLYVRRAQSYSIWRVPRPDHHTSPHDVALDDKPLVDDDEIVMIHKMSPELANKIKSLDAATLGKISSVPPKIWERVKQMPLEAFNVMLELEPTAWDECMKTICGERTGSLSRRTRRAWRETPQPVTVTGKPKEHGDGPRRAPSRTPVPVNRCPKQKTRSHHDENVLDQEGTGSQSNREECVERKHVADLPLQKRQRTTQSTRGVETDAPESVSREQKKNSVTRREQRWGSSGSAKTCGNMDFSSPRSPKSTQAALNRHWKSSKTSNIAVRPTGDWSSSSSEKATKNIQNCRHPRAFVSKRDRKTNTFLKGSTGWRSVSVLSPQNSDRLGITLRRRPEPTQRTTDSHCDPGKTPNIAVDSTAECSSSFPEPLPRVDLRVLTPNSPRGSTPTTCGAGSIIVSPRRVRVPIVDESAVRLRRDENDDDLVELGQGAFSTVFLADLSLQRETHLVAVKTFTRPESNPSDVLREARITMLLADTGFVPRLYGYLVPGTSLVQECFGQGTTLEDLLSASQVFLLSKDTWLSIANQLAQGLSEFFHRGVLHNDIKPENILVDWTMPGYPVKYIDFGRATYLTGYRFTEKDLRSAKRGQLAPELWFGNRTTTASDVFSLGRVMISIAQDGGHLVEMEDVARKCVKPAPTDRPEVDTIVRDLKGLRCHLPA